MGRELDRLKTALASSEQTLQQVRRAAERLRGELRIAGNIQRAMLPAPVYSSADAGALRNGGPGGLKIAAALRPAKAIAGDFYDYFAVGPHGMGLSVGDVSDKGVAAA